jgi:hypothetical protein
MRRCTMACQVSPVDVVDKPRSNCSKGVKTRFAYVRTLRGLSRKWKVFLIPDVNVSEFCCPLTHTPRMQPLSHVRRLFERPTGRKYPHASRLRRRSLSALIFYRFFTLLRPTYTLHPTQYRSQTQHFTVSHPVLLVSVQRAISHHSKELLTVLVGAVGTMG